MERFGRQVRRRRQKLGLTLDELAARSRISKPYLSLIETGRLGNPPSDEKLRRLEEALGFSDGELVTQAHLYRTPSDVRALLMRLMADRHIGLQSDIVAPRSTFELAGQSPMAVADDIDESDEWPFADRVRNLLKQWANEKPATMQTVPVINRRTMAYPRDFTDMDFPSRMAEEYVACPDVVDDEVFAVRVHGDSMRSRFQEGDIVIFAPGRTARQGDDCFIRMKDGRTNFRRVFFESGEDKSATIRLQPRNERYRAEVVSAETVAGMYRAVYRYHSLDDA